MKKLAILALDFILIVWLSFGERWGGGGGGGCLKLDVPGQEDERMLDVDGQGD